MVEDQSGDRPFDVIAETLDDESIEAFELLGNETRLEIIVALWDAIEMTPIGEEREPGLSFTELYDRVGVQDSGKFNYHLEKLTGTFVAHEESYTLTGGAFDIIAAIIKGAGTESPSFTDEPIDADCPLCGASMVIDYESGTLRIRCTNCRGNFRRPDDPPGMVMSTSRPPVGLTNRSPEEFFLKGNAEWRHRVQSFIDGACARCTGTVSVTPEMCETHEPGDDSLCPQCNRLDELFWLFVCDVCKKRVGTPGRSPIWAETAVMSFCYERGLDVNATVDRYDFNEMYRATDMTVSARDPLEVTVTVELEGDRLTATLDEDANVVTIEEATDVA
jgi:hypothetical protein